jgi:hypothetical protein
LWASPSTKDALRGTNKQRELIPSDPEKTKALESYLTEIDADEPEPEPQQEDIQIGLPSRKRKRESEESTDQPRQIVIKIPQRRWLEEIALDEPARKEMDMELAASSSHFWSETRWRTVKTSICLTPCGLFYQLVRGIQRSTRRFAIFILKHGFFEVASIRSTHPSGMAAFVL